MRSDTAFIAGMVFVIQHNAAAMASVLCEAHIAGTISGHNATAPFVKIEHAR